MNNGSRAGSRKEKPAFLLTKLRRQNGMSKAALARAASIDQGLISKIESGRVIPYPKELERLARALGVEDGEAQDLLLPSSDCGAPVNKLPETGYLRLAHIIGNGKAKPPVPAIIPVSKSTWWAGVRTGRFPKPVKLGPNTTAWRAEDIRDLIEDLQKGGSHSTSPVPFRREVDAEPNAVTLKGRQPAP